MRFRRTSWAWGLLAVVALLWPARLNGPLDGAPLDGVAEALLIGLVFPALWWFRPQFLTTTLARSSIVALLAWKAFMQVGVVQDGWCVKMMPTEPYVKDGTGAPHSWDVRAEWRAKDPACSAVMTGPYRLFADFPAWFFNLPPPNDSWPGPKDRPPGARVKMMVRGFLHNARAGALTISTGPDVAKTVYVDGAVASGDASMLPGTHLVVVDASLTGDRWTFVPSWNGRDLWRASPVANTMRRPSRFDLLLRPWGGWITAVLAGALIVGWGVATIVSLADITAIIWMVGASACLGLMAATITGDAIRWAIVGLAFAAALPIPRRLQTLSGAFALVGVPWLTLFAVVSVSQIGRFTLYAWGNDYWTFQRFAYRIVMQGYWLEGGSPTFWFQPLYRWIAGVLHLVFGDSSVGEVYWDAASALVLALWSFRIAESFARFRWGIIAAVTTLAVIALGTPWGLIGIGLGEMTSAGLLYAATLCAWRSRDGRGVYALTAGVLATLAFYTRLNNLPMAYAVALFALPPRLEMRSLVTRPSEWFRRTTWSTALIVIATVSVGILLFTWRTWHYTGVFNPFYGTQREQLAVWQPGMSLRVALARMFDSVMMVLTVTDPPRVTQYCLPVLGGAVVSLLALAYVPWARNLPAAPILFFVAAVSGALIARGSAYPGRFSVHVIAVASTLAVCGVAWVAMRVERAIRPMTITPVVRS